MIITMTTHLEVVPKSSGLWVPLNGSINLLLTGFSNSHQFLPNTYWLHKIKSAYNLW